MNSMHRMFRMAALVVAALLPVALHADTALPYKPHAVTAPDGVSLAVQEWGKPDGPAILFVHGFAQSHLGWEAQVRDSALAEHFRMVTFDLRGHGMSDKPVGAGYYAEGARWAGDIAAIIDTLGLDAPVIVASSFGGRVTGNYVAEHGGGAISGLVLVGALIMNDPMPWMGPGAYHLEDMVSPDLATALDGTRRFIEDFYVSPPPEQELRRVFAYNMMTPHHVRMSLQAEADHERHWQKLELPVLLSHGTEDRHILLGMSERAAELFPKARTSFMEDVAHFPFVEAPERFNAELADFVRAAHGRD